MDDEAGFEQLAAGLPPARRLDLEFGRALARGFTGIDRPASIVEHVAAAHNPERRAGRLLGVTWAMTARRMNDPAYFEACLSAASPVVRDVLAPLPDICDTARSAARSYADWQDRTLRALPA